MAINYKFIKITGTTLSEIPAIKTLKEYASAVGVYKVVDIGDYAGKHCSLYDRKELFQQEKSLWNNDPTGMSTLLYFSTATNTIFVNAVSMLRKYDSGNYTGTSYPNSLILMPIIVKTADINSKIKIQNSDGSLVELAFEDPSTLLPWDKGMNFINWDNSPQSTPGLSVLTSKVFPNYYTPNKTSYMPILVASSTTGEIALQDTYNNCKFYSRIRSGIVGGVSTYSQSNGAPVAFNIQSKGINYPYAAISSNYLDLDNPQGIDVAVITSKECNYVIIDNVCLTHNSSIVPASITVSDTFQYGTSTYVPFNASPANNDLFGIASAGYTLEFMWLPLFKSAIFVSTDFGGSKIKVFRVTNSIYDRNSIANNIFRFQVISGIPGALDRFTSVEEIQTFAGVIDMSGTLKYTLLPAKKITLTLYACNSYFEMDYGSNMILPDGYGFNRNSLNICEFNRVFEDIRLLNLDGFSGWVFPNRSDDQFNHYFCGGSGTYGLAVVNGALQNVTNAPGAVANMHMGLLPLHGKQPNPKYAAAPNNHTGGAYDMFSGSIATSFTGAPYNAITGMVTVGNYQNSLADMANAIFVCPRPVTP